MTRPLRALIADDEAPARQRLIQLLQDVAPASRLGGVEVVGESAHGEATLDMAAQLRPDLVFLDVEMPEMSGLEVAARLGTGPSIVFTTAFDQYALSAFELGALDYLRKPFGADRLRIALARLNAQPTVASQPTHSHFEERLDLVREAQTLEMRPIARLFVRDRNRIVVVRVADIERLAGEDDYVALHMTASAGGKMHLVYLTLAEFERRLDPAQFLRVHRSHIVNLDHVAALEPFDATRLSVVLRSGARITASRSASRDLRRLAI